LTLNAVTWLGRHYLTVTKTGSGSGTVTSSTGAINCGGTCAAAINYGGTVTLTASPASGSTFAGWSGAGCSGTGTCTVTMNAAQAVTAAFNAIPQPQPQPQPVQISGAGETHKKFRVSRSPELAQISKKLAPIGTTFKFTLSGAATVRLDFTQPGAGRKVAGKCVAPTKHNKHNAKCTLLAGSSTFSGHAGRNTVAFKGWLSHSEKLKPGHYTLVITAITPGVGTTTTKLNFTVVK